MEPVSSYMNCYILGRYCYNKYCVTLLNCTIHFFIADDTSKLNSCSNQYNNMTWMGGASNIKTKLNRIYSIQSTNYTSVTFSTITFSERVIPARTNIMIILCCYSGHNLPQNDLCNSSKNRSIT